MAHRRSDKDIKKMMHGKYVKDMTEQPCWGLIPCRNDKGLIICGTCDAKVECKVEQLKRGKSDQSTTKGPRSKTAVKKWLMMAAPAIIENEVQEAPK
jgi:hypothetical protein